MNYKITFRVEGDWVAETHEDTREVECDNLTELAEQSWGGYCGSLTFIRKRMESDARVEVRPNPLFSIKCTADGVELDEEEVLEVFFKRRVNKLMKSASCLKSGKWK